MDTAIQNRISGNEVKKNDIINILIVDDRPENLLTMESILESNKRKIFRAESGNDALKIAMRENIGLIMLDIQMPEMDGIEVAQILRSNPKTKRIPIIFVSAIAKSEKPSLKIFDEGSVDFIFKPLDLEDTLCKVSIFERMYWTNLEQKFLTEQLDHLQKESEKILSQITNDFKLPVKAMENLTNWIEEDALELNNPNLIENLALLKNRSRRLQDMIEGLSSYISAQKISEHKSEVNCSELVKQVLENASVPKSFKVSVDSLPQLNTEKNRLSKVFHELIRNAIVHHHDPKNGTIHIKYIVNSNGEHQFSVEDNGPGVKPGYQQNIFELFQSVTPNEQLNTPAVGLAIVKNLVHKSGGSIGLLSNPNTGCCFQFTWK